MQRGTLLKHLAIEHPILQAPMAGITTPALAAAVSNAGGLGALGIGAMTAAQADTAIRELQSLTNRPIHINVFTHQPAQPNPEREAAWLRYLAPHFARFDAEPPTQLREVYKSFREDAAMLEVLLATKPTVVSFHFGLPTQQQIAALHEAGITLLATATSVAEAKTIEAAGIDAIIAQGIEAGGHRGMFDPTTNDEQLSTLPLTQAIHQATNLPIISAGAIMRGEHIRTALHAGAEAAQLGTAFLSTPEAATDATHRKLLLDPTSTTRMTTSISGRPARCIENLFTQLDQDPARPHTPDYPITYDAGKALNAAAKAKGEHGYSAQWAGTGVNQSRAMTANELMQTLIQEFDTQQT